MRDIEIIGPQKWSKLFAGRMERKIDVEAESVIRVREKEREGESLSRNELRTIFISHEWLASIRPSRAGLFSSLINTGAHPPRHGFSSGG